MEPGHEDREYVGCPTAALHLESASMEPGHEDREYLGTAYFVSPDLTPQWSPVMKTGNTHGISPVISSSEGLNGARS